MGWMSGEAEGTAWRSEVDRATSRATDAKVVAARARERANAARNAVHRLERSVEELRKRYLTAREIKAIEAREKEPF